MGPDRYLPYVSRLPLTWPESDGPSAHEVEGTLLLVDVAGFTSLSERLARTGRGGAEEVTDLVGATFARLLAAAYEDGGSLLSFGGDALLLFFTGADHPRRAAHAAGVIRRRPRELGALRTSVGAVRLQLSMGAHSGTFRFLVVGDESRVLLVVGPDVTTTVRLEQRAQAGQVLLGPALAATVPEAAGPVEHGAAHLLRVPRPPVVGDPQGGAALLTRPERFLSPPLRDHVATPVASEHRHVAVGFVQLQGTDQLLAQEPDAALSAVHDVVRAAQRAADEYGVCLLGSDVDADGAKLVLVAGAPRATEHEEERLLLACRAVLDVSTPLQLRAGVTAGHVFAGDVGPPYRRAFTVMGERVNLAARLMGSAQPGELRTTPSVVAATGSRFVTTALEPLALKGVRAPVEAVAVGAQTARGVGPAGTDLVGRDPELLALRTAVAAAVEGRPQVLELVGQPGIGKTALVSAALEGQDLPVLRVTAAPYESETPLAVVKRLLRALLEVDAAAPAARVRERAESAFRDLTPQERSLLLVAADTAGSDDPQVSQDELFLPRLARALRRALEQLRPGPLVLVLEDLHAADPSSRSVVAGLARQAGPWLLCLTRRPQGPRLVPTSELLELGPLAEDAARDLVHGLTADAPLPPRRVTALVERSGGNPLFLTELVRSGLAEGELPETVEAVVNARIDRLPPDLRRLVRQVSVLGTRFELDLVAELVGTQPDRGQWAGLEGVLAREGSRAAFASELVREVAYHSLPFRERREMHGRAGRALASRGSADVELLALHASQAHDDELTWRFAVEAGRRAHARGAHEQAALFLRRGLLAHDRGRLGPAEETASVLVSLGDAEERSGRPLEAVAAYRRARLLSPRGAYGDPRLLLKEGLVRLNQGRHAAAARWFRRGLEAVGPGEAEAELELLAWSAGNSLRQGRYRHAVAVLEDLLARTKAEDHPEPVARAHYLLHLIFTTLGDDRRAEHRSQALPYYEAAGDLARQASIHNNLGMDAYYEGRWTDAVALFELSRRCEEQDANDVGAAISESNVAEVLSDQGHLDEAHRRLDRALRTFRAHGFGMGTATALYHLGRLETRRGRLQEAEGHLGEALEVVTAMDARSLLPDVLVRQAELAVVRGKAEEAERLLDQLAGLPDIGAEMSTLSARLRAALAVRRGETGTAEQLLRSTVASERTAGRCSAALARHSLSVLLHQRGDDEAGEQRELALQSLRALGVHRFLDPVAGPDLVVISLPTAVAAQREPTTRAMAAAG